MVQWLRIAGSNGSTRLDNSCSEDGGTVACRNVVLLQFRLWTNTPSPKEQILCQWVIQHHVSPTALNNYIYIYIKVEWSRYRPGVAQRVGRGIALLFHDRGTRGGWVVTSTTRPHFTLGKDPVLILQEAGWAPGPVWTGGKSRPHRDSIPDRPARSSVAILSYPANTHTHTYIYI